LPLVVIYVWEEEGVVVDEFSSEGVYLGHLTGTPAGPFSAIRSVAVGAASHEVYVGDVNQETGVAVVDVFGLDLVVPDVVTEAASSVGSKGATLNGEVNPVNEGEATCRFVWGTTKQFGQAPTACSAPVAQGSTDVAVQAPLSGLEPDTTYFYRLQATNKNGTNTGEEWQDGEFTTLGPGIHDESASDVTSTSATLNAAINPHKASTSYYFEYGPEACATAVHACDQAPVAPGVALGSAEGDLEVSQHLQALSAGTLYHYRVVTVGDVEVSPGVSRSEEFEGPDQTFTTQAGSGGLTSPDGRQWELVSPPDKRGALIEAIGEQGVIQAAAGGGAITYLANSPTEAQPRGYAMPVQVLSTRTASGWQSHDIANSHDLATTVSVGLGDEYRFFSEDLSLAVLQPFGSFVPLSGDASEQTPYLRSDYLKGDLGQPCIPASMDCYRPLAVGCPQSGDACAGSVEENANVLPRGTVFGKTGGTEAQKGIPCPPALICGPQFVGASPDASHVVLVSSVALTSTPIPDEDWGLYEWGDGKLALINVLPESGGGGVATGAPYLGLKGTNARHAVSDDGSRVFWSTRGTLDELYMRDVPGGETVQLDTVQGGSGKGAAHALFQLASSDGSRAFFTDSQQLTSGSAARFLKPDLYECEIREAAGKLECGLSDLTPSNSGESADVQGVPGASTDGSWVYFVANGVLAPGAVPGHCVGSAPAPGATCNLYMHHDGTTRLVAVLSGKDLPDWGHDVETGDLQKVTARVSPDGRWLAFMSQRKLTGYDNRDAFSGAPDEEVYLYDGETGKLVCASCNPSGARPVGEEYEYVTDSLVGGALVGGDRVWTKESWLAANVPGWTPFRLASARYQSRYLSDSGRLFFNSHDALAPQAVNGTWNVYEYEPPGVGDCAVSSATFAERSGGCVGLISSGSAAQESAFLDAGEGGGDVFFLTGEKLTSQDFDKSLDVYDAHECSNASPCLPASVTQPPECTTADACRAAPTPQPSIFGSPSSATFTGAGNASSSSTAGVKLRSLTRAQKLARALKACRERKHKKRVVCKRLARKRFAAGKASAGPRVRSSTSATTRATKKDGR
jgi:hypothetical protein